MPYVQAIAISAFIVASLSFGVICYLIGSITAGNEADKRIATMRREYIDAINALYNKFNLAMQPPLPPQARSSAKPRPKLHIFTNDNKKDDKPSK